MHRERILLVDQGDNVIGEKWRDELTNDDCWRIVSIWVTDEEGRVLLQQRSLNKKHSPGIWTAAAEGTVDYDDDFEITAYREVEEEIGLNEIILEPTFKYYGPWASFGKRQCQGFRAVYSGNKSVIRFQESEVGAIKWFTLEEIEDLHDKTPDLFPLYDIYKALKFIN